MSLTTHGYLQQKYLSTPYLASTAEQTYGSQVNLTIAATKTTGMQVTDDIVGFPDPIHSQVSRTIASALAPYHSQVQRAIASTKTIHMQVDEEIAAYPGTFNAQVNLVIAAIATTHMQANLIDTGGSDLMHSQVDLTLLQAPGLNLQVLRQVANYLGGLGMSAGPWSAFYHEICQEYLVKPYLATPYLANDICAHGPMQVARTINAINSMHMQVEDDITVPATTYQMQVARTINAINSTHMQILATDMAAPAYRSQVSRAIAATKTLHGQIQFVIAATKAIHSQVLRTFAQQYHSQATLVLYNTTNLRVLDRFPSRGTSGTNWVASSTASGDYGVNNVNNDIVEFAWRSNSGDIAGVTLTCDTEVPQGIFLDTLGILGHNFTLSAVVVLQGTNDPLFGTVDVELTLETTLNNMYYIAPILPGAGYWYWRFVINDPTNLANYLQVGTIVFGASIIFIGEDLLDQIKFSRKHFKDVIQTEGFTNVSNDRALRRTLSLMFKDLDFQKANYASLNALFEYARTSLKCLWIPTPRYPTRFALFGKLVQLPDETHNDKGEDINYIDLNLDIDESL